MDRNTILSTLIERETGRVFAGGPIWEEIERAVDNFEGEDGEHWITGQDDVLMKWDYYVNFSKNYDAECDQWETDISLLEVKIEDKQEHKTWYVKVSGAVI